MSSRKIALRYGAGVALLVVAMASNAAIDVTAAVTGIGDALTALLAVIGALMALSVSIFGIVKVYKFVSSKAGA